jgi:hypothetical protein
VFRAHRYGPDHPALQGRDLTQSTTPTSTACMPPCGRDGVTNNDCCPNLCDPS